MTTSDKKLMEYLNADGQEQLIGLLYDMDLMPEQLKEGSRKWVFMKGIIAGWSARAALASTKEGK